MVASAYADARWRSPADAQDIYTEGFSSPGIRLVEKGALRQDVMDTLLNMVRSPEMVTLDMRSMIACNNVARDRMLSLIGKYGYDTVDAACQLLIDQSEELLRQRLAELPDGQWQSRQYLEVKDEVYEVLLTMTKKADELVFDFTGSSPQAAYSVNCTKWASLGGLFAPLFPLLCYDITWNEGVIRPITMIAPEGSIVNCTRPAPVSVATVGAIQSVNNAACSTIGKMLEISGKYREEATRSGTPTISPSSSSAATSMAARPSASSPRPSPARAARAPSPTASMSVARSRTRSRAWPMSRPSKPVSRSATCSAGA